MASEVLRVFPKVSELNKILNRIECPEKGCSEVFQNTPNLTLHLLKTHRKERSLKSSAYGNKVAEYYCPEAGCKYSFNPDLINSTADSKFSNRHFTQFKYLKQHYIKVHLDKTFKCEKCNKGFPTELHRLRHVSICGSKYTCSCGAVYSSLESLQTHARREQHEYNKESSKGQNTRFRKTTSSEAHKDMVNNRNATNLLQNKHRKMSNELKILIVRGAVKLENRLLTTMPKSERSVGSVSIGTQTDISTKRRRTLSPAKNNNASIDRHILKKRTSKETQTGEKRPKTTSETQTVHQCLASGEKRKGCCKSSGRKRKTSMATQTSASTGTPTSPDKNGKCSCSNPNNSVSNFNEIYGVCSCTVSNSSLASSKSCYNDANITLTKNVNLPQMWLNDETVNKNNCKENKDILSQSNDSGLIDNIPSKDNKNISTSFLQGIDESTNDQSDHISLYNNGGKFTMKHSNILCDIETQTECGDSIDAILDDYLTNFEKNTNEVDDILDQYTQTCDDFVLPDDIDLCLTNNETQTAWPLCDDTFNISDVVNTETQTIGTLCLDDFT